MTFQKEYTYQAGEADSKLTCRAISLEQVKRLLLEELGTYLESRTEVKDFRLTKDQVVVLTAGIVQTEIVEEKWNGAEYYLRARISANPDDVTKRLGSMGKDRETIRELQEERARTEEALKEIEKLRAELLRAKKEAEKKDSIKEGGEKGGSVTPDKTSPTPETSDVDKSARYADAVKELEATDWFEKGYSFRTYGRYEEAIAAFTRAIEFKPMFIKAYINRGISYRGLGKMGYALKDFNKALEVDPKNGMAYFQRGITYWGAGDKKEAKRDLDTASGLGNKKAQDFLRKKGVF